MSTAPVVVGVDGSDAALAAVVWAADEAHRRAAPLRVVTAFGWEAGLGHVDHYRAELLRRARTRLHEGAVAAAERAVPGLPVSAEVVVGFPTATLYEESRHAQLLVLGSRGLGGVAGLLVGSVTVALTARARCPVVVVPERPAAGGPVVVGVAASDSSDAAIAFAFESAAARRVPLVAVHTWSDTDFDGGGPTVPNWGPILERVLAERLAGWPEKHPDVAVRREVGRYGAAATLVALSVQAQLVVVGSHGRGNLAGLLRGSVGHAVLHHGHCPVAVVRPGW